MVHANEIADMEIRSSVVGEIEDVSNDIGEVVELSLDTVVGFSTPGTMKLQGMIQQRKVIVLVDCGMTHNFISETDLKT